MFPTGDDFIVMVVGGPNQRTDFHVDPYEEFFYQIKGNMHVNVMTAGRAAGRCTSARAQMWMLPRNTPHSPQRPEAGSIGLVVERVREEGTLEKFQWYCPNCDNMVHEVELQVRDIVDDLPPVFQAFYDDEQARTCAQLRHPAPGQGLMATPVVDVHTHVVPKGWPDLARRAAGRLALAAGRLRARRHDHGGGDRVPADRRAVLGRADAGWPTWTPTASTCRSSRRRRSSSATTARPTRRSKVARIFNDLTLEVAAAGGDRLVPFCQVPLQDPDAGLRRAGPLPAPPGTSASRSATTSATGTSTTPGIVQFLQHCAAVGAPVFVHPWDMPGGPRLDRWMARWLTGMPAETHLSILAMILGGVFDRVPETLRICFAHGGGSFPFWLGRADNAWHRRGDVVRGASAASAEPLRRPVLRRLGGLRPGRAAAAGRHAGGGPGAARQRLPVPAGRAAGRRRWCARPTSSPRRQRDKAAWRQCASSSLVMPSKTARVELEDRSMLPARRIWLLRPTAELSLPCGDPSPAGGDAACTAGSGVRSMTGPPAADGGGVARPGLAGRSRPSSGVSRATRTPQCRTFERRSRRSTADVIVDRALGRRSPGAAAASAPQDDRPGAGGRPHRWPATRPGQRRGQRLPGRGRMSS